MFFILHSRSPTPFFVDVQIDESERASERLVASDADVDATHHSNPARFFSSQFFSVKWDNPRFMSITDKVDVATTLGHCQGQSRILMAHPMVVSG